MKHLPYNKFEGFKRTNNITNADIAKLLGISECAVINKNRGVSDYYISEIKKLMDTYNLSCDIFL